MSASEMVMWAGIAVLGLFGSALCSGMETGLYSFSRARIALWAREGRSWARVLEREGRHADRAVATILIANNVFNYIGVLGMTALLSSFRLSEWQLIVLNAAVVTPVLLVVAEATPKELFRRSADGLMLRLVPLLAGMRLLLTIVPVLPFVVALARVGGRLTGLPPEPEPGMRQMLAEMLKQDDGTVSIQQAELIDRALAFRRATVGAEMTPWSQVQRVELAWPRARVRDYTAHAAPRRYPVVDERGQVVGILDSLDLLLDPDASVARLMTPPVRVGPRMPAREALALMRTRDIRMLIVEQHGQAVGIVTPKDLVEPLVGELLAW